MRQRLAALLLALGAAGPPSADGPPAGSAVAQLIALGDDAGRAAWLDAHATGVGPELRAALVAEARGLFARGRMQPAVAAWEAAYAVDQRLGTSPATTEILVGRGLAREDAGDNTAGSADFEAALTLAERYGQPEAAAQARRGRASIRSRQGDHEGSAAELRQVLQQPGLALPVQSQLQRTLCQIELRRGLDYAAAQQACRTAVEAAEGAGASGAHDLRRALATLALVEAQTGRYTTALGAAARARDLSEAADDRRGLLAALAALGSLHTRQGNVEAAVANDRRALELASPADDPQGAAMMHYNLAVDLRMQDRFDEAERHLRHADSVFERLDFAHGRTAVAYELALLAKGRGQRGPALAALRAVLEEHRASRAHEQAVIVGPLAELLLQEGQPEEVLRLTALLRASAEQAGDVDARWVAYTYAGLAHEASGRLDDARREFLQAVATVEDLRAQAFGGEQETQHFFEQLLLPYHGLLRVLLAEGRREEALELAERCKGRLLLALIDLGRARIDKHLTAAERHGEQARAATLRDAALALRAARQHGPPAEPTALRELEAAWERARADFEDYRTRLYARYPELRAWRAEAPPARLGELAELLPDSRRALVEFVVMDQATLVFVLRRAAGPTPRLTSTLLPLGRQQLAERVAVFRKRIQDRDLEVRAEGRALHAALLAPLESELAGVEELVLSADGPLWELPFQALVRPSGRYLVEELRLSYTPSLSVLRAMRLRASAPRRAARELLALGAPTLGPAGRAPAGLLLMGAESLPPLPDAARQVRALRALYGRESAIYVGPAAGEARFKAEAGSYRVLHLATHGLLNDRNPLYSQLVLATQPGGAEDGLLEAREVLDLDLAAELVVLSACETGRGRVGAGEGVVGLAWAFFVAGSPSTVVSQWKVDAASTTALMTAFHRRWRAGQRKAEALRAAARSLLAQPSYRHPFFWAGFVVMGDGD